jgi:DNA-nicking Smr family endonuclease
MLSTSCGTRTGYNKHLKLKEPACADCKKAQNEYSKQYQKNNPDKRLRYSRNYRKANAESVREYNRRFYLSNREHLLAQCKEYYRNNKQQSFAKARRRKAKLASLRYEPYTVEQIIELYGNVCHICKEEIDLALPRSTGKPGWEKGLHLEHVIPISKGGTDTVDNVKPSHAICNLLKGTKVLEVQVC